MDPNTATTAAVAAGGSAIVLTIIIVMLVGVIIHLLFCWSNYKSLKMVPEDERIMPAWFYWLTIIPFIGFIFYWLMMPFGGPKSFENHLQAQNKPVKPAKSLFGVGLAAMICVTLLWVPFLNYLLFIAYVVLYITYWIKVVNIRQHLGGDSKVESHEKENVNQ